MYSSSAMLEVWFTATAVLVTKLLLGRQKSQFNIVRRSTKGPGQKNLVNTDGILLFKHKPFIPVSLQVPLSLQSSLAKPAPPRLRLLKHSTFFPGCLCVAVLLFQNCVLLHFGPFFFPPHHSLVSQFPACYNFYPLQMSWLWLIYAPDPSHSQHPPENGELESAAWVPCQISECSGWRRPQSVFYQYSFFPFSVHKLYCCT